jgi:hypothetical protein
MATKKFAVAHARTLYYTGIDVSQGRDHAAELGAMTTITQEGENPVEDINRYR